MDKNPSWFVWMCRYSEALVHITWILLLGMLAWTIGETSEKGVLYFAAIWQMRNFLNKCVSLLEAGNWEVALALAEKRKWSHVAMVVASGLREYRRSHSLLSATKSADFAEASTKSVGHTIPRARLIIELLVSIGILVIDRQLFASCSADCDACNSRSPLPDRYS